MSVFGPRCFTITMSGARSSSKSSWLVAIMKVVLNRSANFLMLCATTAAVIRSNVAQNSSMQIIAGFLERACASLNRYRWPSDSCWGVRKIAKASDIPARLSHCSVWSNGLTKQSTSGSDDGSSSWSRLIASGVCCWIIFSNNDLPAPLSPVI